MTHPNQDQDKTLKSNTDVNPNSAVSFAFEQPKTTSITRLGNWLKARYLWFGLFLVMGSSLYWVIFVLPNNLDTPVEQPIQAKTPTLARTEAQTPWQDAQQKRIRAQAQEVLAALLTQQQGLLDKKVRLWSEKQYETAIATAQAGDTLYQAQKFTQAIAQYKAAGVQLALIEKSQQHYFEQYYHEGITALASGDAVKAKTSFTTALYIQPNNQAAGIAFDRSLVLDKVITLIAAGEGQLQENQFHQAKDSFEQALTLDSHSQSAKSLLASTIASIKQSNFQQAMSQGYNSLHDKQFTLATKHFKRAQSIDRENESALIALAQVKDQMTSTQVTQLIASASEFEAKEQWLAAKNDYQKALNIDNSLLAAKVGKLRSNARLTLENKLTEIINHPLQLNDEQVFQHAKQQLLTAQRTKSPGSRLLSQLARLETTLQEARQTIAVKLESDNHTKISLYKVGVLGQFSLKELKLNPGKYTVVGIREGYQDVRHQFTLQPNGQPLVIVIACDKKVTNG